MLEQQLPRQKPFVFLLFPLLCNRTGTERRRKKKKEFSVRAEHDTRNGFDNFPIVLGSALAISR